MAGYLGEVVRSVRGIGPVRDVVGEGRDVCEDGDGSGGKGGDGNMSCGKGGEVRDGGPGGVGEDGGLGRDSVAGGEGGGKYDLSSRGIAGGLCSVKPRQFG